jgi:hypothetical protein
MTTLCKSMLDSRPCACMCEGMKPAIATDDSVMVPPAPPASLAPADVCDVVGGMLRQMERVGDEDVWGVVAMLGDMLRREDGAKGRLGWLLRDMAEVAAEGGAVEVRRLEP